MIELDPIEESIAERIVQKKVIIEQKIENVIVQQQQQVQLQPRLVVPQILPQTGSLDK